MYITLRLLVIFLVLFIVTGSTGIADEESIGGINLLPGYHVKKLPGVDVTARTIEKPGGIIIHFEAGPSEGLAVSPQKNREYAWSRKQSINGHLVLLALTRPGVKSGPDLDKERNLPPGNILMVSYPLGGQPDHAANFIGKVANSEEMIDMLLMTLTFDPAKGNY
ncbi:MAG: hypothetical protein WAK20_05855 [Candidatus Acidiferrum sp.]